MLVPALGFPPSPVGGTRWEVFELRAELSKYLSIEFLPLVVDSSPVSALALTN